MLTIMPTFGADEQGVPRCPYTFDPFDKGVGMNLILPSSDDDRRAVIDFTTVATAAAVPESGSWAAALAYSVLKRAGEVTNTCDLQLRLVS